MRLTVWDPFREMAALQRVVNAPFRDFPTRSRTGDPLVKVVDKGDSALITAEIPGVKLAKISLVPTERWLQTMGDLDALLGDGDIAGQAQIPDQDPVTRRLHLAWLSVHNPYLDDLTPRDAGKTSAGMRKVTQLARCLPAAIRNIDGLSAPEDAQQVWPIWDSIRRDEWIVQDRIMRALWARG